MLMMLLFVSVLSACHIFFYVNAIHCNITGNTGVFTIRRETVLAISPDLV